MEFFGQVIIYLMMFFLVVGAVCYAFKPESELGNEFREGIQVIGHIFIPVAGMMAMIPILAELINLYVAPIYALVQSDPSIAVSTFIPSDQGAYMLAHKVAGSHSAWILAYAVSMTAGTTIAFTVPIGLAMLEKKDHKFMALGVMSGLLAIPFAAFIIVLLLQQSGVLLREAPSTEGAGTLPFDLPFAQIVLNLAPLMVMMIALSLLLRFKTRATIHGFLVFGHSLRILTTLVLAACAVEYFTGLFSTLFGGWALAPFIADADEQFRALEVAGYIGVMLAGAFPFIYVLRKVLEKPMARVGRKIGISDAGMVGFIAAATNALALFRLYPQMTAKEKVLTVAFTVCAGFAFGDFLAFTANFQPNMIGAMILGKVLGGLIAVGIALWLSVPVARRLEHADDAPREERLCHSGA